MPARGKSIDIFVCLESFVDLKTHEIVRRGDLVRAGHPLLADNPRMFARAEDRIRFDVEQATAAPGSLR